MSIARIGETQAKPESIEELRKFWLSIMPGIKATKGCEFVTLYQSQEDPTRFTMIEIWDSVESHKAAVMDISPDDIAKVRTMLASAPSGSYFDVFESAD
ncbi:MAG: antibiotic biosynthesis monooxygenase [Anaerolineales bacterium]